MYLSISPVYWVPWLSVNSFTILKYFLVACGLFFVFLYHLSLKEFFLPKGVFGPIGFVFLLLSASSGFFLTPDFYSIVRTFFDFLMGFVFLWCFYLLQRKNEKNFEIFSVPVIVLAILGAMSVANYLTGVPSLYAPTEFYEQALWTSGFGASRTGWSNGISLYAVWAICFAMTSQRASYRFIFFFAYVCLLGSQIVCAGRAGILVSLLAPPLYAMATRKGKLLFLQLVIFLALFLCFGNLVKDSLRVDRLQASSLSLETIDYFSANRISSYIYALDLSKDQIWGYGFGRDDLKFRGKYEIHNLLLRFLVEGGILLSLSFLIFLISIFFLKDKCGRYLFFLLPRNPQIASLYVVILSGVLISMFEPNALVGSFQLSCLWWASVGSLLGLRRHCLSETSSLVTCE